MSSIKFNARGRGYSQNIPNRYSKTIVDRDEDDYEIKPNIILTEFSSSNAKSIISVNHSPDVPFEQSVNAYRGCEHGCVYCFARPTHAYLDLSPSLDFETNIFFKANTIELLKKEISKPGYKVKTISLGNVTDTYQPVEKTKGITREILKLMYRYKHPVSLVTKSSLIERDIDLLAKLADDNLVHVSLSITTLDKGLAQKMEPRATTPNRRLKAIKNLTNLGIPVSVLVAPIIPVLTDYELENILHISKEHGAYSANFVMLRLPHELKEMFESWLQEHYPLKSSHILKRIKEMHDGELYKSTFGKRMRGSGNYARMIENRFNNACKKINLNQKFIELETNKFLCPKHNISSQLEMF